jgi:hypothetical protein
LLWHGKKMVGGWEGRHRPLAGGVWRAAKHFVSTCWSSPKSAAKDEVIELSAGRRKPHAGRGAIPIPPSVRKRLELIFRAAFNRLMKFPRFKFAAFSAMLFTLTGCIVLSVYPFYTSQNLVSDPGLAGRWMKVGKTNEIWQFMATGEKSFRLTTTDESSTNCFEARVFQLEQNQFLDLLTTNREMFQLPLHLLSKFRRDGTNLALPFMDYGWLTGFLETNRGALRHIIVPQESGNTNGGNMVYLTSTTRELQKFIIKRAADTNVFGADSLVQLQRLSP